MKILQVIGVVSPDFGGPSIGSVRLNAQLRSQGVNARIISTSLKLDGSNLRTDEVSAMIGDEADVCVYPPSFPRSLQNSTGLVRALLGESRNADAIHLHGQYLAPHVAGYLISRWRRIKFGVQPHGGLEPYQRKFSSRRKKIYNAVIGNRILREAHYVLFASHSEARNASDMVRPDQAIVAPLGAHLEEPSLRSDIDNWLGGAERSSVVLFIGRLASKKRPTALIDMWSDVVAAHPEARLIIAGPDSDHTRSDLQRRVADAGHAETILVPGPVVDRHKSWLFRRSGIFALPSENENFGVTVAEAMLAGCVPLVTEEVAAGEHVRLAGVGRPATSLEDFVSQLVSHLDDPSGLNVKSEQAAAYAQQSLSWRPLATALIEKVRSA